MLAFLAVLGTVCVAVNPDLVPGFDQLSVSKVESKRNLNASEEFYKIFSVSTQFKNTFNLVGLPGERVIDLKERIQLLQGIPRDRIALVAGSEELLDYESAIEIKSQALFMVLKPKTSFRLTQRVKSDYNRHLDEEQVDITVLFESSHKVSLLRYKQIWESIIGMKYGYDYDLKQRGESLDDDLTLLDDSFESDYELHLHLNIDEMRSENILLPPSPNQCGRHMSKFDGRNYLDKFVKITRDSMIFDEGMHIYNIQDYYEDHYFNAMDIQWQRKNQAGSKMFVIDNDGDPSNDGMILFEKTEFNQFEMSTIKCVPARTLPDIESFNHFHLIIPAKNSSLALEGPQQTRKEDEVLDCLISKIPN